MKENNILFAVIIGILLLILLIIGMVVLGNNGFQSENCRLMSENGHNTRLEVFGNILLDCYVEISPEKYVPYDRYRGIGDNK